MDKSGSRHPSLKSPLIERPDLQTRGQRTLYGSLTIAFWAFWIYLWVPLLALLAWLLGIEQAYQYMVVLGGYNHVLRVLEAYSLVILALGGSLMLWAAYNIYRFRGVEKRSARPGVTHTDIAGDIDHDPLSVKRWHGTQRLVVSHDETGRLVDVHNAL
jgi:biofilm PGA synthesis protein PgaD